MDVMLDVPYRCPRCGGARTFSTLAELKSHMAEEHAFSAQKRQRLKLFDYSPSKHTFLGTGRYSPTLQSLFDEGDALEEEVKVAKQAERNNKLQRMSKHRPSSKSPSLRSTPPPASNHTRQQSHPDPSKSTPRKWKPHALPPPAGPLSQPADAYLQDTVSQLNHDILSQRQQQFRTADALYSTQDVLSGVEEAAEGRVSEQRGFISDLSRQLLDKERQLLELRTQLEVAKDRDRGPGPDGVHWDRKPRNGRPPANMRSNSEDSDQEVIESELIQKRTELEKLNRQLASAKQNMEEVEDPVVLQKRTELEKLNQQLASAKQNIEVHQDPVVLQKRTELEKLNQQLASAKQNIEVHQDPVVLQKRSELEKLNQQLASAKQNIEVHQDPVVLQKRAELEKLNQQLASAKQNMEEVHQGPVLMNSGRPDSRQSQQGDNRDRVDRTNGRQDSPQPENNRERVPVDKTNKPQGFFQEKNREKVQKTQQPQDNHQENNHRERVDRTRSPQNFQQENNRDRVDRTKTPPQLHQEDNRGRTDRNNRGRKLDIRRNRDSSVDDPSFDISSVNSDLSADSWTRPSEASVSRKSSSSVQDQSTAAPVLRQPKHNRPARTRSSRSSQRNPHPPQPPTHHQHIHNKLRQDSREEEPPPPQPPPQPQPPIQPPPPPQTSSADKLQVQKLKEERSLLVNQMKELLSKATTDNEKLKDELMAKENQLQFLNQELERTKSDQTELMEETYDLYKEAEKSLGDLKHRLQSKESQLDQANGRLDEIRKAQDRLIAEKEGAARNLDDKDQLYQNMMRDRDEQIQSLNGLLLSQQDERQRLQEMASELKRMVQEKEKAELELSQAIATKEEELAKAKDDVDTLSTYLQTAAAKESAARCKLEAFVTELIDRADCAEKELNQLRGMQNSGSGNLTSDPSLVGGVPSMNGFGDVSGIPGQPAMMRQGGVPMHSTPMAAPQPHGPQSSMDPHADPALQQTGLEPWYNDLGADSLPNTIPRHGAGSGAMAHPLQQLGMPGVGYISMEGQQLLYQTSPHQQSLPLQQARLAAALQNGLPPQAGPYGGVPSDQGIQPYGYPPHPQYNNPAAALNSVPHPPNAAPYSSNRGADPSGRAIHPSNGAPHPSNRASSKSNRQPKHTPHPPSADASHPSNHASPHSNGSSPHTNQPRQNNRGRVNEAAPNGYGDMSGYGHDDPYQEEYAVQALPLSESSGDFASLPGGQQGKHHQPAAGHSTSRPGQQHMNPAAVSSNGRSVSRTPGPNQQEQRRHNPAAVSPNGRSMSRTPGSDPNPQEHHPHNPVSSNPRRFPHDVSSPAALDSVGEDSSSLYAALPRKKNVNSHRAAAGARSGRPVTMQSPTYDAGDERPYSDSLEHGLESNHQFVVNAAGTVLQNGAGSGSGKPAHGKSRNGAGPSSSLKAGKREKDPGGEGGNRGEDPKLRHSVSPSISPDKTYPIVCVTGENATAVVSDDQSDSTYSHQDTPHYVKAVVDRKPRIRGKARPSNAQLNKSPIPARLYRYAEDSSTDGVELSIDENGVMWEAVESFSEADESFRMSPYGSEETVGDVDTSVLLSSRSPRLLRRRGQKNTEDTDEDVDSLEDDGVLHPSSREKAKGVKGGYNNRNSRPAGRKAPPQQPLGERINRVLKSVGEDDSESLELLLKQTGGRESAAPGNGTPGYATEGRERPTRHGVSPLERALAVQNRVQSLTYPRAQKKSVTISETSSSDLAQPKPSAGPAPPRSGVLKPSLKDAKSTALPSNSVPSSGVAHEPLEEFSSSSYASMPHGGQLTKGTAAASVLPLRPQGSDTRNRLVSSADGELKVEVPERGFDTRNRLVSSADGELKVEVPERIQASSSVPAMGSQIQTGASQNLARKEGNGKTGTGGFTDALDGKENGMMDTSANSKGNDKADASLLPDAGNVLAKKRINTDYLTVHSADGKRNDTDNNNQAHSNNFKDLQDPKVGNGNRSSEGHTDKFTESNPPEKANTERRPSLKNTPLMRQATVAPEDSDLNKSAESLEVPGERHTTTASEDSDRNKSAESLEVPGERHTTAASEDSDLNKSAESLDVDLNKSAESLESNLARSKSCSESSLLSSEDLDNMDKSSTLQLPPSKSQRAMMERASSTDFDLESDLEKVTVGEMRAGSLSSKGGVRRALQQKMRRKLRAANRALSAEEESGSNVSDNEAAMKNKRREEGRRRRVALFRIFWHLDTRSLCKMALVCKEWQRVSRTPALWTSVHLKYERVSPQVAEIEKHGLRYGSRRPSETMDEYQRRTKGILEPGLEELLKVSQNSLTSLSIIACGNVFTDKCMWLVSGYCRLLQKLTYLSDTHPLTAEIMWALGGGCPSITSLIIPPLFPCHNSEGMNNRCLMLIAQFYPDLLEVGVGGRTLDITGLAPLVQSCQRLTSLCLDHIKEMGEDSATGLCRAGLRQLQQLELNGTSVTAEALLMFYNSCRHLKDIRVFVSINDFFEDVRKKKNKEEYKKVVQSLEDLKSQPGLGNILQLRAAPAE